MCLHCTIVSRIPLKMKNISQCIFLVHVPEFPVLVAVPEGETVAVGVAVRAPCRTAELTAGLVVLDKGEPWGSIWTSLAFGGVTLSVAVVKSDNPVSSVTVNLGGGREGEELLCRLSKDKYLKTQHHLKTVDKPSQ